MSVNLSIIALILSLLSILGLIFVLWQTWNFNKLRRTLFAGSTGADLENIIQSLAAQLQDLNSREADLEKNLAQLKHDLSFAIQRLGLVRFNPFADDGGNFSFSLALLDIHQNGVVITSMHGRQQNRIYTKRITAGKSETQLTAEEEQAIKLANDKPGQAVG